MLSYFTLKETTELIKRFSHSSCRILVIDNLIDGNATVDIAHEAVFSAWPQLDSWISKRRNNERELAQTRVVANDWVAKGMLLQDISTSRIGYAHLSMRNLNKAPSELDENSKSYLFPQQFLIELLNEPLLSVPHEDRALIGDLLMEISSNWDGQVDLRPGVRFDTFTHANEFAEYWCDIDAGQIKMDSENGDQLCFDVEKFKIGKWPVTQLQYREFIESASGYTNKDNWIQKHVEDSPASSRLSEGCLLYTSDAADE